MPQNPLAPFLQEPFNAKNAQNCQMHLFPPTRSIMKKFFGHAHKKINSLGETGTKFSYRVKVQDLKTCKSIKVPSDLVQCILLSDF